MFGFRKRKAGDDLLQVDVLSEKSIIHHWVMRGLLVLLGVYLLVCIVLGVYWSSEPSMFSVEENAQQAAVSLGVDKQNLPTGFVTTETLRTIASTLVNKPGGYLSNDKFPPGVWLDNIPSWEYGVIRQIRDMSLAMQRGFSRSQSQSSENGNLESALVSFNADSKSWLFPPAEDRYKEGVKYLAAYEKQLFDPKDANGKFYARADNLAAWLSLVETQLGSLSQQLSASVGQEGISLSVKDVTDQLSPKEKIIKTPWFQIDNVFYEARGQAWALVHLLRAVEVDFHDVLAKKSALVSLRQIIRSLEATQQPVWSPVILNGSGFGILANHSLVMASYISSANAAIMDLRKLLEQG